jgi:hypothetical protein
MSDAAFPSHITAALDQLSPPPLPRGFADRLVARIEAGDLPANAEQGSPPLPLSRRHATGVWRRSGRLGMAVAALGIAAASGAFGDPIYVPVVSETLAKAKFVELPSKVAAAPKVESKTIEAPALASDIAQIPEADPIKARQALRDLHQRLRANPEFRRLPPDERRAMARQEVRGMIDRGEISIDDLKASAAAMQARRAAVIEARRNSIAERRVTSAQPSSSLIDPTPRPRPDPERVAARQAAWQAIPVDAQQRLRELRAQLRDAPPAERPAIRREMRQIWQSVLNKDALLPEASAEMPESEYR